MQLLTTNSKLAKGECYGYIVRGLQLLPGNKSGKELCPHRGACFATCLDTAGHGRFPGVADARYVRARLWIEHPDAFVSLLRTELEAFQRQAQRRDMLVAIRLNVISDVSWEQECRGLFADFPDVQFYDYTKNPARARHARQFSRARYGFIPPNYDLTYSWSEQASPHFASMHLKHGGRIAFVRREGNDVPPFIQRAQQVDGDEHDLTFLHPPGSVLVLSPKGKLASKRTRFA